MCSDRTGKSRLREAFRERSHDQDTSGYLPQWRSDANSYFHHIVWRFCIYQWKVPCTKISFSSSEGGQVQGKTQRTAETFKGAVHGVIHRGFPNWRHIQIVEVVFHEYTLSNSLGYGGDVLSKNVQ